MSDFASPSKHFSICRNISGHGGFQPASSMESFILWSCHCSWSHWCATINFKACFLKEVFQSSLWCSISHWSEQVSQTTWVCSTDRWHKEGRGYWNCLHSTNPVVLYIKPCCSRSLSRGWWVRGWGSEGVRGETVVTPVRAVRQLLRQPPRPVGL